MGAPDLERSLRSLAAEVAWPETPELRLELAPRPPRRRVGLALALAAILAAVVAALAVPSARTAILRFFHLRGATVELVDTLPPAQEQPLGAGLGPVEPPAQAARDLGFRFLLPPGAEDAPIHVLRGIGAALLAGPEPILLTELAPGGVGEFLKKIASVESHVEFVSVGGRPGIWIAGPPHVYFEPAAPPRVAGNTLLWQHGALTLRLEGRHLTLARALELARSIE